METRPLSKDKRWRLVEIMERAKSVSYTHLDVYKRQLWELAQGFEEALWLQEKSSTEGKLIPVDETKK